jgi:hypothetical protein
MTIKNQTVIKEEIKELKHKLQNVQGSECEVYTRIVGYYRSVANWNVGKSEEYKFRKEFDITKSDSSSKKLLLITKDNCPKCVPVKNFLSNKLVNFKSYNASTKEGLKVAQKYNVLSTPTLLILDSKNRVIENLNTVEEISKLIK